MSDKKVEITLSFLNENLTVATKALKNVGTTLTLVGAGLKALSKSQSDGAMKALAASTDKADKETKELVQTMEKLYRSELQQQTALSNLYVTSEKVAKQTSNKIQKTAVLAMQEERLAEEIKKITRLHGADIAATEKSGRAYKFQSVTLEEFLRIERSAGEVLAFMARKRVEETSATRVSNKAKADAKRVLKEEKAATAAAAAAKRKNTQRIKENSKAMKDNISTISNAITATINIMRTMYSWLTRIYNVAARLVNGLIGLVTQFGEFQAIARSASFILQTTQSSIAKISSSVNFLGISMTDAAQGLDEFGRAGYKASEALKAFTPIAMFADAVNTNLGRATTMVTGAMKSFSFGAEDVWRITSGMTNAVYDSRNSFETLETAFSYAGAAGAAFGQQFEHVLAAVMAFRDLGLKASTAGTIYRRSLAKLANATGPTIKAFEDLGLNIDRFTIQTGNNFNHVVKEFAKLKGEISETDFSKLLSKTISPRFASYMIKLVDAVKEGTIDLDQMVTELEDKTTTLEDLARYNLTTMEQQIRITRSMIEKLYLSFGDGLQVALEPFLSAFNALALDMLEDWELVMADMGKAVEEGAEKITKEDMAKKFKEWEKSTADAFGSMIKWLQKYKTVIEKIIFIGEVLGKTIALPFVIIGSVILKMIAHASDVIDVLKVIGTVFGKLISGLVLGIATIVRPFTFLGEKMAGVLGIGKEAFKGLNKWIDETAGKSMDNLFDWSDVSKGAKEVGVLGNAILDTDKAMMGMYKTLVTTNLSGSAATAIDDITLSMTRLQNKVSKGSIGSKISGMLEEGKITALATIAEAREKQIADRKKYLEESKKKEQIKALNEEIERTEKTYDKIEKVIDKYQDGDIVKFSAYLYEKDKVYKKMLDDAEIKTAKYLERKYKTHLKAQEAEKKADAKAHEEKLNMINENANWQVRKERETARKRVADAKKFAKLLTDLSKLGVDIDPFVALNDGLALTVEQLEKVVSLTKQYNSMMAAQKESAQAGNIFGNGSIGGSENQGMLDVLATSQSDKASMMQEQLMQNNLAFEEQMIASFETVATAFGSLKEMTGETAMAIAGTMQAGLSSVFMELIKHSGDVKKAFRAMGKSILKSLVDMLTKMILQTVILGSILGRTQGQIVNQQAKATAATAELNAWRAGWQTGVGPASMAAAFAFRAIAKTQNQLMLGEMGNVKGIKGFNSGTGLAGVPGFGNQDSVAAMLTPGEIVFNPAQSNAIRAIAQDDTDSPTAQGSQNMIVNIYAHDYDSFKNRAKDVTVELVETDAEVRRAIEHALARQGA